MNTLIEVVIDCPYCGEKNRLLIEPLAQEQEYTEDCRVCCRPMVIAVSLELDGTPSVTVRSENETP